MAEPQRPLLLSFLIPTEACGGTLGSQLFCLLFSWLLSFCLPFTTLPIFNFQVWRRGEELSGDVSLTPFYLLSLCHPLGSSPAVPTSPGFPVVLSPISSLPQLSTLSATGCLCPCPSCPLLSAASSMLCSQAPAAQMAPLVPAVSGLSLFLLKSLLVAGTGDH